jgi:hypothetical protein
MHLIDFDPFFVRRQSEDLEREVAKPAHAQESSYALTGSATGGKVTGPGIDCGAGAADCLP